MSREHTVDASQIHHDWDASREPALDDRVRATSSTSTCRSRARGRSTRPRRSTTWSGTSTRSTTSPARSTSRAPPRRHARGRDPRARRPGRWGWTTIIPELGLLAGRLPRAVPEDLRPQGPDDGDCRPGRRGSDRSPSSARWACPPTSRARLARSPAQGRRQRRLPPPHRRLDAVAADLVRRARSSRAATPTRRRETARSASAPIECAMQATLRFRLERSDPGPAFRVPAAVGSRGPYYGTMGIDADLMEGARTAVRNMIAWLVDEHGLEPRGRLRPLQPRRRPPDPRDRRRRRLERRHDDAARRLRLNSPRRSGQRRRR